MQMDSQKYSPSEDKQKQFQEAANSESPKLKLRNWLFALIDPFFFIAYLTILYIAILLADSLIIFVINWSLTGTAAHLPIVALLLEGVKVLSALGTAIAYALHLGYTFFQEGKHFAKVIRENSKDKVKIS